MNHGTLYSRKTKLQDRLKTSQAKSVIILERTTCNLDLNTWDELQNCTIAAFDNVLRAFPLPCIERRQMHLNIRFGHAFRLVQKAAGKGFDSHILEWN